MKTAIVSLSEISKHPKNRLDAGYWVSKEHGDKAFKKKEGGRLIEDDVNGTIFLKEQEAAAYNETLDKIDELKEEISGINKKVNP